jgi:hypothetical protein
MKAYHMASTNGKYFLSSLKAWESAIEAFSNTIPPFLSRTKKIFMPSEKQEKRQVAQELIGDVASLFYKLIVCSF